MKKILFLFTLVILAGVISINDTFAQIVVPITVTTDKTSYKDGDTIFVTGEVSELLSGTPISLIVTAPDGNRILLDQLDANLDKTFSAEITPDELWRYTGTYTIEVTYGSQTRTAETAFTFESSGNDVNDTIPSSPEDCTSNQVWQNNQCVDYVQSPKNDLNLHTDQIIYGHGDVIVISGLIPNIENFDAGDVSIIIRSPDDNIVTISQTQANSDGSFQTRFSVNPSQFRASGDYIILANFKGLKSQITVEIIGIPDSIVVTTDKPSYEDGDTILVTGEVSELLSGSVSLNVLDPKERLVTSVQVDVGSDRKFSTELTADNALMRSEGTYKITAFYGTEHRGKTAFTFAGAIGTDTGDESNKYPLTITQNHAKGILFQGNHVTIYGTGTPLNKIQISISNNNANQIISSTQVQGDGNWQILWIVPQLESGKWYLLAEELSTERKIQTSFVFSEPTDLEPVTPPITDDLPLEITIVPTLGSGAPSCEETVKGCYIPNVASIAVGGKVIFSNTDTAAHTFTAGTAVDGFSGEFDTGLIMAGSSYEWTATTEGQYDYYCMVHPWMTGTIFVGEGTYIPPQPEDDFDLQVVMGNQVYDLNVVATMNLSIKGTSNPQNVALEISDPVGTTIISRSFMVDSQGIGFEFKIDENFKTGTYKVVATTSNNGNTITDTAYFKVKSQYNSFKITSVQVTDQQGNPSNLQAGEMGFIKVNLDASKSITTLVTVNLFDSELTSIGIGSIKTTLSSGNSEIILSFMIPSDVAVGSSNVYVNAFSDWVSNGGIPLTGEVSITENIE